MQSRGAIFCIFVAHRFGNPFSSNSIFGRHSFAASWCHLRMNLMKSFAMLHQHWHPLNVCTDIYVGSVFSQGTHHQHCDVGVQTQQRVQPKTPGISIAETSFKCSYRILQTKPFPWKELSCHRSAFEALGSAMSAIDLRILASKKMILHVRMKTAHFWALAAMSKMLLLRCHVRSMGGFQHTLKS